MLRVKRLRVDFSTLQKKLEIVMRMLVDTQLISRYRSVFRGRGLEFEDFRDYVSHDDASRIDWKTSMRARKLLIKLFREERDLDVPILLDTSSSMVFGSTEKLKMEYAAEVAAAVAYMVINAGDRAGLMMFNDKIAKMVPISGGEKHFKIIMNSLVDPAYYGGGFDLPKAINFGMGASRKKGLMVIISDFIGMKKGWERLLRLASVKFDVLGLMIRDPRDDRLPEGCFGQFVLRDPYSEYSLLVDPRKVGKEYSRIAKREKERLRKTFLKCRADLLEISTGESFIKPLVKYFIERRMRTWR